MEKGKTDKTRRRTRARELALEAVYMADQRPELTAAELKRHVDASDQEDEVRHYAWRLVDGVAREKKNLDAAIQKIAINWEISRMPIVDRNVLRMASYEILYCADIPRKVAINEAIDLAKKYSTAESGAFVNGILDKITPPSE
jgi:transcription antitermination protein NusB